jgi:glycosyltransferase involved in cell wall biosynthesis
MKIGIDAKYYFSGTPSLISVVSNLCDKIIENSGDCEIIIFLSSKDKHREAEFARKIAPYKNVSFQYIPGRFNFIVNMLFYPLFFFNKKIDVIIFQNYIPIWKFSNTLYVNYVHDFLFLDYPHFFSKSQRVLFRFMLYAVKRADHVITISESERDRILKHSGIDSSKIDFVYHGINETFSERSLENKQLVINRFQLPKKFLLYVGRLNRRKNIKALLGAFSMLKSDISLVIIGKSEFQEFELDNEILRLGIKNPILKFEYVPIDDLQDIISAATVFIFPSFAEGFGLPPLEAMRSGVPTIVSVGMAMPEICRNGALYFDPYKAVELAEKIDFLLSDQNEYNKLKLSGKLIAERYTWDKSAKEVLTIVKNLLI